MPPREREGCGRQVDPELLADLAVRVVRSSRKRGWCVAVGPGSPSGCAAERTGKDAAPAAKRARQALAWYPAAADYDTDFGALPKPRHNMLRWMLEAPEAREPHST